MKALTIWQPWALLIMIGAKPYEFRRWDYRERERALEGQRIVIHGGARPMKLGEVCDVIERAHGGVLTEKAGPLLRKLETALVAAERAMPAYRSKLALRNKWLRGVRFVGEPEPEHPEKPSGQIIPLAAGLGTAKILKPRKCTELFGGQPDSDRIDHHMWAWPLVDIVPFAEPVPMRGAQGFWTWPYAEAA